MAWTIGQNPICHEDTNNTFQLWAVRVKISVVTVTYNNIQGLLKTKKSLEAQVYSAAEWIVIDGGSHDGTKAFLQTLKTNIVWVSEPDEGIYDAMNKGINLATGNYICFMNAGDYFCDNAVLNKVSTIISKLQASPPSIIYGGAFEKNSAGKRLYKKARAPFCIYYGMICHHQAMFFNRSAIGNGYDLEITIAADYALIARLYKNKNAFYKVDFPICYFERGGLSQTADGIGESEQWQIRKNTLKMKKIYLFFIFTIHTVLNCIRKLTPKLYDLVRFR